MAPSVVSPAWQVSSTTVRLSVLPASRVSSLRSDTLWVSSGSPSVPRVALTSLGHSTSPSPGSVSPWPE